MILDPHHVPSFSRLYHTLHMYTYVWRGVVCPGAKLAARVGFNDIRVVRNVCMWGQLGLLSCKGVVVYVTSVQDPQGCASRYGCYVV